MIKKKIFLNDQKKKDLEGFEDILDLIDPDGPDIQNVKNQQIEDYEIYDFLEKENLRLEKIDQFLTTHLPIDKKHSQTKKLIEKERKDVALLREELVSACAQEDSGINYYLGEIFRNTF